MLNSEHYKKEIIRQITRLGEHHSTWRVFEDFLEMSAISISNAVDWIYREERETRYIEITKRYSKNELDTFPSMLSNLVEALEAAGRPTDVLGEIFHELELHNKYKGQFFTPQVICDMMAEFTISIDDKIICEQGYISTCEPCCGSGAMVLGLANKMIISKLNPCSQMVVTAIDVDMKCVFMCYLQLSLFGIPAVVVHGDTLALKEWSHWCTPIYILDGWNWRQKQNSTTISNSEETTVVQNIETAVEQLKVTVNQLKEPDVIVRKNGQISLF